MVPLLLLVALVMAATVELFAIVQVAHVVGVLATVGLLFLVSIAGAWLCKREGLGAFRRFQADVARGEMPGPAVVDGLLILTGGFLMVVPGFVSGALGLLLLVPLTRRPVRALVIARVHRRLDTTFAAMEGFAPGATARWRRGRAEASADAVVDVDGWEEPVGGRPQLHRGPSFTPRGGA